MDPLTQVGAGKVDGILFALQCRKPKPKTRLVAFTGLAGSGKSTAAQVLIDAGWVRVKFADILKSMLQTYYEMCGLGRDEISRRIEGDLKEEPDSYLRGCTPRHAMQTLGGEWGRDLLNPDLWVNAWQKRVELQLRAGLSVVVDDLRYANEETALRALGGEVIVIKRVAHKGVPQHPSEGYEPDADAVIQNDGNIPELHREISRYIAAD